MHERGDLSESEFAALSRLPITAERHEWPFLAPHFCDTSLRRAPSHGGAVRTDLARDFQVAVVYAGSGLESIAYQQDYGSSCAGAGPFVDQETDTVSPMAWSVRYVVDMDRLFSAVRASGHVTLVLAVMVIVVNLLADLISGRLDPRVQTQ